MLYLLQVAGIQVHRLIVKNQVQLGVLLEALGAAEVVDQHAVQLVVGHQEVQQQHLCTEAEGRVVVVLALGRVLLHYASPQLTDLLQRGPDGHHGVVLRQHEVVVQNGTQVPHGAVAGDLLHKLPVTPQGLIIPALVLAQNFLVLSAFLLLPQELTPAGNAEGVFSFFHRAAELLKLYGELASHDELEDEGVKLLGVVEDTFDESQQKAHPVDLRVELPLHAAHVQLPSIHIGPRSAVDAQAQHQRVSEDLLESQSILAGGEGALEEVLGVLAQLLVDMVGLAHLLQQSRLILKFPRKSAVQQHVQDHPEAPDVALVVEQVFLGAFRTLVGVELDFAALLLILQLAGVAEAAQLHDLLLEEKAGGFESAVDVLLLREEEEPRECVLEVDERLVLNQFAASGDAVVQVALVAEFSDDVAVIDGAVDVVAVDEVGVLQLLEHLDLSVELLVLAFLAAQVDDLDGHQFAALLVESLEGVALVAQVQVVVQAVGVVLDLLAQLVAVALSHYQPIDLDRYNHPSPHPPHQYNSSTTPHHTHHHPITRSSALCAPDSAPACRAQTRSPGISGEEGVSNQRMGAHRLPSSLSDAECTDIEMGHPGDELENLSQLPIHYSRHKLFLLVTAQLLVDLEDSLLSQRIAH